MRHIFIDLGAYNGDTIEMFCKGEMIPLEVPITEYAIYAFEPNPVIFHTLKWEGKAMSCVFDNKAAWTENGTIEFTIDNASSPLGSTLMKSKKIWGKGTIIEVESFDFSEWIKQFKDDDVIVKMDIEGAEFPILEKMIADGTLSIIKKLFVEMHPNKVTDYTTTDKNELVEKIKQYTEYHEWH